MRIELKKFGDILISRPAGREAYLAMEAYILKGLPENEPIEIDFSGIKVLTPSWADEVVTKLTERPGHISLLHTENASVQATLKTLREFSGIAI